MVEEVKMVKPGAVRRRTFNMQDVIVISHEQASGVENVLYRCIIKDVYIQK